MNELILKRYLPFLFLFILLFIGVSIFQNYGVHWDEYNNQDFGHTWKVYVFDVLEKGSIAKATFPSPTEMDLRHGPFVELSLNILKNTFKIHDLRNIILFRHLSCFLIFTLGIVFFYLLCNYYFKNWKASLLACLFLVLSPRIFAHSFYDTFDIPFLSFYIISIYTLLRLLDQKTFINALFHSLSCAILIDTRIAGLIIPLVTIILYGIDIFKTPALRENFKIVRPLIFYSFFLISFVILGWPLLWPDPLTNFLKVFHETQNSNFPYTCLFWGNFYMGYDLPWYNTWVWIFVTTPILYGCFFLSGLGFIIQKFFSKTPFIQKRNTVIISLCFFIPLLLATGKTYNGWRHLYFIYPAFILISMIGLLEIWQVIKNKFQNEYRMILQCLLVVTIIFSLWTTVSFMIKNHPLEHVYFNQLAGKDMHEVRGRFELDYWGLSYRKALEFLVKSNPEGIIRVTGGNNTWPLIKNNLNMLEPKDKERILETTPQEAQFFITNYLQHPNDYPLLKHAAISIGNTEILTIYKLK